MTTRIDISALQSEAIDAMMGLENYVSGNTLSPTIKELIKLRVSMINNCAYCIEMHTPVAQKNGLSVQKMMALSAWPESPLFSEEERAVLALADEMTLIAEQGLTDKTYQQCIALLGDTPTAQCMMQVVTINAWNRIAVSTKMTHSH
ncbi:carboxymuconolactone decarboxylase family protein [Photobacterium nomapromontoriensis]|uniref:carboxymuconolactone decarboxylase family protein n=1 Tax=Photobacterium nomapromontoriensis TaxID=2910237 RepID=UPI003D145068